MTLLQHTQLNTAYKNTLFKKLLNGSTYLCIGIFICFIATLLFHSKLTFSTVGINFIYSDIWEPNESIFGALPFIIGTLLTSILALFISIPFSLAISIYIGFYLKEGKQKTFIETIMDVLAGIPSVIYGFWGLMILVPLIINFEMYIETIPYGVGILAAALILSIMIIPYAVSISKEVIRLVPNDLIEAAYSLGATPFEVVRFVVIPYCLSGIFSGQIMGFGRAISETMAVTMVIGNRNFIPQSIFDPANTLASVIANEFGEASDPLYISSLIALALILMCITIIISFIGRLIIKRYQVSQ